MLLRSMILFFLAITGLTAQPLPGWTQDKKEDKKEADKQPEPAKDVVVNDELINADLKDTVQTQSFCKTYTFNMKAGKTYMIEMTSNVLLSYLRLEDPGGQQVAANNNADGGRNARFFYSPPKAGDYQIVATSSNGGATGKFTLLVREVRDSFSYTGRLLGTDPRYKGKNHKLLLVQMEAGKTYQIDMKSRAFDAYLFLEDPNGTYLTQDDDSGGNLDARIIYKAQKSGKHRVICTHFGGAGGGDFTLTVLPTSR